MALKNYILRRPLSWRQKKVKLFGMETRTVTVGILETIYKVSKLDVKDFAFFIEIFCHFSKNKEL